MSELPSLLESRVVACTPTAGAHRGDPQLECTMRGPQGRAHRGELTVGAHRGDPQQERTMRGPQERAHSRGPQQGPTEGSPQQEHTTRGPQGRAGAHGGSPQRGAHSRAQTARCPEHLGVHACACAVSAHSDRGSLVASQHHGRRGRGVCWLHGQLRPPPCCQGARTPRTSWLQGSRPRASSEPK